MDQWFWSLWFGGNSYKYTHSLTFFVVFRFHQVLFQCRSRLRSLSLSLPRSVYVSSFAHSICLDATKWVLNLCILEIVMHEFQFVHLFYSTEISGSFYYSRFKQPFSRSRNKISFHWIHYMRYDANNFNMIVHTHSVAVVFIKYTYMYIKCDHMKCTNDEILKILWITDKRPDVYVCVREKRQRTRMKLATIVLETYPPTAAAAASERQKQRRKKQDWQRRTHFH